MVARYDVIHAVRHEARRVILEICLRGYLNVSEAKVGARGGHGLSLAAASHALVIGSTAEIFSKVIGADCHEINVVRCYGEVSNTHGLAGRCNSCALTALKHCV